MEIKFLGNQINLDIIFGFKKKLFKVELLQWTAIILFHFYKNIKFIIAKKYAERHKTEYAFAVFSALFQQWNSVIV